MRILVVDDDKNNRAILEVMLSKLGHEVALARNGQEALGFILGGHDKLDLVFMDVHMPDISGIDATKIVRDREAFNNLRTVPIIAVTAYGQMYSRDICLEAGMDDFIQKPVKKNEIIAALDMIETQNTSKHQFNSFNPSMINI